MPKTQGRHKKTGPQSRKSGSPLYGKPRAIADLLARPASPLVTLRKRAQAAQGWLAFVREWLPADLAPRVNSAAERDGTLTIYVESAAWAARLRFTTEDLLARAQEANRAVQAIRVRVLPSSGA